MAENLKENQRSGLILTLALILATCFSGLPRAIATIEALSLGPVPAKRLEVFSTGPFNPIQSLDSLNVEMTIKDGTKIANVRNLRVVFLGITNVGKSPVLPSEIIEPISLSVSDPWTIIDPIKMAGRIPHGPHLIWRKTSDHVISADRTVLNPGDRIDFQIYLIANPALKSPPDPVVIWDGRIANLKDFSPPAKVPGLFDHKTLIIFHTDWAVAYIIAAFTAFEVSYLILGERRKLLEDPAFRIWFTIISSIISISAAESSSEYIFKTFFTQFSRPFLLNMTIIVLNFSALLALALGRVPWPKSSFRGRPPSDDPAK